jgi:cytochrome oxidase Cu insertion factor (SCO1/SenC/PrrC family)
MRDPRRTFPVPVRVAGLTLAAAIVAVGCASVAQKAASSAPAVSRQTGGDVGDLAPDFALPNTDGSTVSLMAYRGRPVVLVFYRGFW